MDWREQRIKDLSAALLDANKRTKPAPSTNAKPQTAAAIAEGDDAPIEPVPKKNRNRLSEFTNIIDPDELYRYFIRDDE
jgi:hypothetical protein